MPENKNPFPILDPSPSPDSTLDVQERIEKLIHSAPVFLFMKGTPDVPMCGFSSNVVGILNTAQVSFKSFDILSDMDLRQGVKDYSNWPTFPQLYVKGELIGGNDIITELFESGELKKFLKKKAFSKLFDFLFFPFLSALLFALLPAPARLFLLVPAPLFLVFPATVLFVRATSSRPVGATA